MLDFKSTNPISTALVAAIALLVLRWVHNRFSRFSILGLPGPPKRHWFFGNLPDLDFEEVGVPHIAWQKQYGLSFKINGLAGVRHIQSTPVLAYVL